MVAAFQRCVKREHCSIFDGWGAGMEGWRGVVMELGRQRDDNCSRTAANVPGKEKGPEEGPALGGVGDGLLVFGHDLVEDLF